MLKEVKAEIQNVSVINPTEYYDYNDAIFQIEIQILEGLQWHAQLMFMMEQVIKILKEFNVRTINDLVFQECRLLDNDSTTAVPLGIAYHDDSDFIPTHNHYFSQLWK